MSSQLPHFTELNEPLELIYARLRILSEEVWENTVAGSDISRWLSNFTGLTMSQEAERLNALHLLSHFNYFGLREIRELLKSVYRDLFRYPIIQNLRHANNGTRDAALLEGLFREELSATRFLGMGNPSESGAHLLYYFRQENHLRRNLFIHQHQILDRAVGDADARLGIKGLRRLVFIDDLLGSGSQAVTYSEKLLKAVRAAAEREGVKLEVWYFPLFAKTEGLEVARAQAGFDVVRSIHEIDDSQTAFHPDSRVYSSEVDGVSLQDGRRLAEFYGEKLCPGEGLGWKNGQLLLGLHHNVPNNTLPIFWYEETELEWASIFPRYNKVYA
ncbi:phosphoribosyltransferase-like protein [Paenarthrobacter nitroguajacolicus]|uniref:phosphoribosyltransferase-like protein n=1 Tax=Paenarthrobacter nitroguajacolicus TaxID=211146 RepID=UPI0040547BD8